jgi:hypothetical protein
MDDTVSIVYPVHRHVMSTMYTYVVYKTPFFARACQKSGCSKETSVWIRICHFTNDQPKLVRTKFFCKLHATPDPIFEEVWPLDCENEDMQPHLDWLNASLEMPELRAESELAPELLYRIGKASAQCALSSNLNGICKCVSLYYSTRRLAREAIDLFCMHMKRNHRVVKDIRLMIARILKQGEIEWAHVCD